MAETSTRSHIDICHDLVVRDFRLMESWDVRRRAVEASPGGGLRGLSGLDLRDAFDAEHTPASRRG
jgi:hypothetical protein